METLKEIWINQENFNKNFGDCKNYTLEEKQQRTKEMVLHLISECDEVLREINWKSHRPKNKPVEIKNIEEELIDVYKYWLTLAQIWDMTPEKFVEEYWRKSIVVEQRYKQEMQLKLLTDKNVVGIDIDGILADYPKGFLDYMQKNFELDIDFSFFTQKTYSLYDEVAEYLGIEKKDVKEWKHRFRRSGEKRFLPVIPGAVSATQELKKKGYTIVLLTARPYNKYSRMFADTIEWLKTNGFVYDAIIWDEDKEERILKEFPNMVFFVDDNGSNAIKIAGEGYKVFLFDKTYNQGISADNIVRVKTWEQLMSKI